jgi:DNA-binding response OmpR family regulator
MDRRNILLVEDEDLIRLLLSEALADDGFQVLVASTGEEAVGLLECSERVDVLFTDIQLPGSLDGLDVAREARARYPNIPIVFTTGQPDRMSGWTIGPHDVFIPKPYRPSEMCRTLRSVLGMAAA